jgi:hypothetical protein
MLDVFSPLSTDARRDHREAYRQFLANRDGEIDLERRTLAKRELGMERYRNPLSRVREANRDLFRDQYRNFDRKRDTPKELLLLIALVKVNAAESYGVNQTYEKNLRRALRGEDDLELTLLVEETYHTRILLSSAILYGIEVETAYTPPAGLRALIGGIAHTPEFISRPLILAGEILGTAMFLRLLHKAREILKGDGELRDAVEERISEILVDEIGHITFNRTCLGGAGLAQARLFVPMVGVSLRATVPELGALGLESATEPGEDMALLTTSKRLPEHIRRAAFIA